MEKEQSGDEEGEEEVVEEDLDQDDRGVLPEHRRRAVAKRQKRLAALAGMSAAADR